MEKQFNRTVALLLNAVSTDDPVGRFGKLRNDDSFVDILMVVFYFVRQQPSGMTIPCHPYDYRGDPRGGIAQLFLYIYQASDR